jgi:hypothetical protein
MSELGDKYKRATEQVLHGYDTDKDKLGRSQKWKLTAIEQDKATGRDTGLMKQFIEDVEVAVNRLESVKEVVANLCKEACKPAKKMQRKVAAEPIEPASPNSPPPADTSVHGIDLGWD